MAFNRGQVSTAVNVEVPVVNCILLSIASLFGLARFDRRIFTPFSYMVDALRKPYTQLTFALPIATGVGNYESIITKDARMLECHTTEHAG